MHKHIAPPLLACLLAFICLNGCNRENISHSQAPTPDPQLSSIGSKTYYHHDGSSPDAQSVTLKWNTDGSVDVERKNVALTDADQFADLVTLDHTSDPHEPKVFVYGPSNVDAWYIPFGNGPIEPMERTGDRVRVNCYCNVVGGGYCDTTEPPVESTYLCWDGGSCFWGCSASISFEKMGTRGPGIVLRATQINLQ